MESGMVRAPKYPTRDCGKQVDEGDFYQVLQEKEEDESLTDATERLLRAARAYICREGSHVWRNAEVSVLGPDDQVVFVSGTQTNRFVVTLDDKDRVKIYCREKSWNSRRHDDKKTNPGTGTFGWRSLIDRVTSKKTKPKEEEVLLNNKTYPSLTHENRLASVNRNEYSNAIPILQPCDIADACEDYYSADEDKITPQRSSIVQRQHKSGPLTLRVSKWKDSFYKNSTVSSALSIINGLFHMFRLIILAYWQIFKCVMKGISCR